MAYVPEKSEPERNEDGDVDRRDTRSGYPGVAYHPQLTKRELEILTCLPTRLSTGEIATRLSISPNTVKTHVKNIYKKLDAGSRNEAIVNAAGLHLLSPDLVALVSRAEGSERTG